MTITQIDKIRKPVYYRFIKELIEGKKTKILGRNINSGLIKFRYNNEIDSYYLQTGFPDRGIWNVRLSHIFGNVESDKDISLENLIVKLKATWDKKDLSSQKNLFGIKDLFNQEGLLGLKDLFNEEK